MATLAQSRLVSLVRAIGARSRVDDVSTHAAALAYQLFLSTFALSLVGLALIGLAEDLLPFELPEGTGEQFANLTGASATLGVVSLIALLWTAAALSRRASRALGVIFRTGPEDIRARRRPRARDDAGAHRARRRAAGRDRDRLGRPGRGPASRSPSAWSGSP